MTTRSRYTAAITDKPWWLAGGIPPDACVAAYQAKGASSLDASYVNLANKGMYNATPSNAPTWNAISGWIFNGSSNYLTINYSTTEYLSGIVKCDGFGAKGARIFSNEPSGTEGNFHIYPRFTDNKCYIRGYSASGASISFTDSSGVLCSTPGNSFINGSSIGTYAYSKQTTNSIEIARIRTNIFWGGNIQTIAFYSGILTSYQVAALTNAMNAL